MSSIRALLNHKIIICYKEEKNIILNLKKYDPFLNFKIMDEREVIERLSFSYDYQALTEIIHDRKVSLKAAKDIVECLRFVNEKNDHDGLLSLKESLEKKKFLVKKEYQKLLLKNSNVVLFNQQNNKELKGLLKNNNIEYETIEPIDLGISFKRELKLISYKNRFEQFNNVCNEICNLLADKENKITDTDIVIRANFDDLNFYFSTFAEIYNLKFYYKKSRSLKVYDSVKNLFDFFVANGNFDAPNKELDSHEQLVFEYIEKFKLKELEKFNDGLLLLNEILDTYKESEISDRGILVTNEFTCLPNKKIFELDFNFDNYPSVANDNKYYSDDILVKLGINPSYIRTQIDNDKKKTFLFFNDVVLTNSNLVLSKEIFKSIYVIDSKEEKKRNKKNLPNTYETFVREEKFTTAKLMNTSENGSKLMYYHLKNNSKNTAELDDLFENVTNVSDIYQYGFNHFNDENFKLEKTSYSALNTYFECPFKYYCEKILKIKKTTSTTAADLGLFLHKLLEDIYDPKFEFENNFESLLNDEKFIKNESEKLFYKYVIKDYARILCSEIIARYKNGNYVEVYSEKEMEMDFDDVKVNGTIDSLLVSKDKDKDVRYITVIDYKTGEASFEPKYNSEGLSLQLPIYSLFVSKDIDKEKDKKGGVVKEIKGVFLQPLFNKEKFIDRNKNVMNDLTISNSYKLFGAWDEDLDYFKSVELSLNAEKVVKSKYFSQKVSPVAKVSDLKTVAETKLKEHINGVKNFEFDILPYKKKKKKEDNTIDGCKYCQYRNICFRDENKFRLVKGGE